MFYQLHTEVYVYIFSFEDRSDKDILYSSAANSTVKQAAVVTAVCAS